MKSKSSILIVILNIFFLFCGFKSSKAEKIKEHAPNIILIFMDDMGYGDLSSFGHPTIRTPNIDRLAYNGQRWTNFYAASSVCSPSRGSLLTGRYPVRIGLGGENQRVFFPESVGGLPSEEITIAEMLKKIGYKTAVIGKWHLGHLPEFLPNKQGFDYFYGLPYSNDMDAVKWSVDNCIAAGDINMWKVPLMENETIIERPANQVTLTKRYTEKAIDFIQKNRDEPFFLYLPHTMVHVPLFVSEKFKNTSSRGLYGDVMSEIDWSVGAIIKTLEDLRIDKNTLVIFTSDNGPWLAMREKGGSAGLLRDGKGTTWEGGMRVPGIFYMPGTVQQGVIEDLGSTLDIFPTIAAFTKAKVPDDRIMDCFDLSPVLKEKKKSARDHFIYYRKQDIYAARMGDYKLHYITETSYTENDNRMVLESPLLFNVNEDPGEKYNLANMYPEILKDIDKLVKGHKQKITIKPSELDKYPKKSN